MKVFINIFSLLLIINVGIGQNREIDSLKALLAQSNEDTNKVAYMNQLAYWYHLFYLDSLNYYANNALKLAQKLDYQAGVADAHNNIGIGYSMAGDYENALVSLKKYRDISRSLNKKLKENTAINNISIVYEAMGNYPKALEGYQKLITYYKQVQKTAPSNDLDRNLALAYMNIGVIQELVGDYPKAFDYFLKSLELAKENSSFVHLSILYLNLGKVKAEIGEYKEARDFYDLGYEVILKNNNKSATIEYYTNVGQLLIRNDSLDQALAYFEKSLEASEELSNNRKKSLILDAIGEIYLAKNKYDTALLYFNQSLDIKSRTKTNNNIAKSYIDVSRAYQMKSKYPLAIKSAHKGLAIALELGAIKEVVGATQLLHTIYHKTGRPIQALKYLTLHKNYSDSLLNEAKINELSNLQSRHEISEITQENELLTKGNELRETQLQRSKAQLKTQKITLISSIIAISATAIFTSIIYQLYVSRKKAHQLLRQLNDEIIDQRDEIKTQAEMLVESNEEISTINESLKNTIQDRTKQILLQNTKIREYAFSNTHKIRTSVLKLREFVDANIKEEISMKKMHQINDSILEKVFALDNTTSQLAELLNE